VVFGATTTAGAAIGGATTDLGGGGAGFDFATVARGAGTGLGAGFAVGSIHQTTAAKAASATAASATPGPERRGSDLYPSAASTESACAVRPAVDDRAGSRSRRSAS
jgi:hypothetical protein